ncbi:MAG: DUF1501 domain-containing protein, partial [Fidelibacterota bacterium]
STDIWRSASDSDVLVQTGWIGRYLELIHPDQYDNPPPMPLALQQASASSLLLTGDNGITGLIVDNPQLFFQIVSGTYDDLTDPTLPDTAGGSELGFVRQIDSLSFNYAQVIEETSQAGVNTVTYPNTNTGQQLEIIARLISGGLDTPFFLTHQNGFDTHAGQVIQHQNLLAEFAQAFSAFYEDLDNQELSNRVLTLTTSEFGRRPFENGSDGTDHGAGNIQFLLGPGANGGIAGTIPDLETFDNDGNMLHEFDFRQLYATVLGTWLGADTAVIDQVLFQHFEPLNVVTSTELPGDVNDDQQVNILDIITVVGFILGTQQPSDEEFARADLNSDGVLDVVDVVQLVNIIMGNSRSLPNAGASGNVILSNSEILFPANEGLAGIQIQLTGDYTLGDADLANGWTWASENGLLLIYNPEGNHMTADIRIPFSGNLLLDSGIVCDWRGRKYPVTISTVPEQFQLHSAYPNPFNPETNLRFYLPDEQPVTVQVYSLRGKRVAQLYDGILTEGNHSFAWHPIGLSSGTYLVQFNVGGQHYSQKVVLLK